MDQTQEQIIDLQSRMAFQDDTLNQLNKVLAEQAIQIDQLRIQLKTLAEKYEDLRDNQGQGANIHSDEPPPHY